MWIFTKYGFYSAVCARKDDGHHSQAVDPNRIMVRARMRSHLQALKENSSHLLGACEIKESSGTDYAFRIFVDKCIWSQVVVGLTNDMDYDDFKSEVARFQGRDGAAYERARGCPCFNGGSRRLCATVSERSGEAVRTGQRRGTPAIRLRHFVSVVPSRLG